MRSNTWIIDDFAVTRTILECSTNGVGFGIDPVHILCVDVIAGSDDVRELAQRQADFVEVVGIEDKTTD